MNVLNQSIELPIITQKKVSLAIKREDKIHPFISGNKYRKLKYNLQQAIDSKSRCLLTFGGAFSNHIAATAYAGRENNIKTIGIIRGEELEAKWEQNPTLVFAKAQGMELVFVSREVYKKKHEVAFINQLKAAYKGCYILPEGGANALAIKGCEEILTAADQDFDVICCAVGTGGTIAGIINSAAPEQRVLGFPALKGDFLKEDICKFAQNKNWDLNNQFNFGGYAKVTTELITFINTFKKQTNVQLDPVYTGKMMFGVLDLIRNDYFKPGTKILAIHTGGLQGIEGMNNLLKKKNLPLIHD